MRDEHMVICSPAVFELVSPDSAPVPVKVELTYKVGKKSVKKTLSLAINGGKFSGTLKLSATDAKKARMGGQ